MALHIILKAPATTGNYCSWKDAISMQDDILLLGEAANLLFSASQLYDGLSLNRARDLFVLKEDMEARGIEKNKLGNVKSIGYDDFVNLTCKHIHIQTWY